MEVQTLPQADSDVGDNDGEGGGCRADSNFDPIQVGEQIHRSCGEQVQSLQSVLLLRNNLTWLLMHLCTARKGAKRHLQSRFCMDQDALS